MKVFYDIENKLTLGNATQVASLSELLNKSDVISLHVPETPETQNIMGAEEFARMKPGSIFINAARGTVVDIDALLKRKKLKNNFNIFKIAVYIVHIHHKLPLGVNLHQHFLLVHWLKD